jgi:hypothetical protein
MVAVAFFPTRGYHPDVITLKISGKASFQHSVHLVAFQEPLNARAIGEA